MRKTSAVALCMLVFLSASASVNAIVMRHDRDEQRYLDLGSRYPSTVSVRPADATKGFGAEGTLIDPLWVLTAAHVAADVAPGDVVEVDGKILGIEKIVLHPEWHQVSDRTRDIALVRLSSPAEHAQAASLYSGKDEVGMTVAFVGRGGFGTGLTGPVAEDRRLRAANNRVDAANGPTLTFRFDAPGDPNACELEGISGYGDSGGPAYVEQEGKLFTLGVSSWQNTKPTKGEQGRYGVFENYTRVSYFAEWIRSTMEGAEVPPPRP